MTKPCSTFKRMLIAVDGSQCGDWAVRTGVVLAQDALTNVMLLHVVEPDVSPLVNFELQEEQDAVRSWHGARLLEQARALFPITADVQVAERHGIPCEEIIAMAFDWGADLIVMGSKKSRTPGRIHHGKHCCLGDTRSPLPGHYGHATAEN